MRGIWPRLILMAFLIPVGWRIESLAQTTGASPPQKADEQEQRLRIVTNEARLPLRAVNPVCGRVTDLTAKEVLVIEDGAAYTLTYLSQKDEIDRAASIPEIRIARPGMSVFTRQAVKFKREAR